jgi:sugar (pentulose or hexulose) kinase
VFAGNDQTFGAFGVGAHEEGGFLLTLGTTQVAYAAALQLPPPAPGQIRGPFPGGLAYRMGADSCGGNVINWTQTVIANAANDAAFFALAASVPHPCPTGRHRRNEIFFQNTPFFPLTPVSLSVW